jgi:hypothetical protein
VLTLGSPELVMLEGEGPFWMHDYTDPSFRDRVAAVAQRTTGATLRRGARARASTDSIVPSRAGYPTATLVSWEPDTKLQSHYHLPTDLPEHVRYDTVARSPKRWHTSSPRPELRPARVQSRRTG